MSENGKGHIEDAEIVEDKFQSEFEAFLNSEIDTSKYQFADNPKLPDPPITPEIKQEEVFKKLISGYSLLMFVDFIFPPINTKLFMWATGVKIDPQKIKLSDIEKKEFTPLANYLVEKWLPKIPPEIQFVFLLEISYWSKMQSIKFVNNLQPEKKLKVEPKE